MEAWATCLWKLGERAGIEQIEEDGGEEEASEETEDNAEPVLYIVDGSWGMGRNGHGMWLGSLRSGTRTI